MMSAKNKYWGNESIGLHLTLRPHFLVSQDKNRFCDAKFMKELQTPQTYSKILHWVWAERCFVLHRGAHLSAVKSQVIRVVVSRILLFSSAFTEISNAPHQLLLSQLFWLSGSCGKRRELLFFYSPPIMHPQNYHSRWHLKGLIFFYMCYQSFAALSQLPEERPCFFFIFRNIVKWSH